MQAFFYKIYQLCIWTLETPLSCTFGMRLPRCGWPRAGLRGSLGPSNAHFGHWAVLKRWVPIEGPTGRGEDRRLPQSIMKIHEYPARTAGRTYSSSSDRYRSMVLLFFSTLQLQVWPRCSICLPTSVRTGNDVGPTNAVGA